MTAEPLVGWAFSSVLLALRIGPVFAFAPPFTLTRVPAQLRVLFSLAVAAALVAGHPEAAAISDYSAGGLVACALRELLLGSLFVLAFQLTFAALYMAGRTIDIQAGFGLAMVIDPTTKAQSPLVGTLFAYAAGAVFLAMDGHAQLLRLLAVTLEAAPLGTWTLPQTLNGLTRFMSVIFLTGLGVGGGTVLALFLADMAISLLSRTTPQLNVLLLGFQVKTLLLLVALPVTLGMAGALLARMMAMTLEAIPRMM